MVVLCRYGEIFLKGKNRGSFEHALVRNLQTTMKKHNIVGSITMKRNRLIIEAQAEEWSFLRRVFGLVSFSVAERVELDGKKMTQTALKHVEHKNPATFKVHTQRTTKTGKLNSVQLNELVGGTIAEKYGWKVKLKNPELTVGIEVIDNYAYVFTEREQCVGGLPVGVSGNVAIQMDQKYSELTALLMMKRGCSIIGLLNDIEVKPNFCLMEPFLLKEFKLFSSKEIPSLTEKIANKTKTRVIISPSLEPIDKINNNVLLLTPLIGKTEKNCAALVKHYEHFC